MEKVEQIKIVWSQETKQARFYEVEVNNIDSKLLFALREGKFFLFSDITMDWIKLQSGHKYYWQFLKEAKLIS